MDAAPLLDWFASAARALPWRELRRDPYRVWVSEVMLQQTRVDTVLRYYEAFLARFPDVHALATSDEDALMKAWEGLGYYRRARLMREGARALVERHDGALPASVEALRALPGFGPYTAGAVASLAFGLPAAAVDGNVLRVWSRITGSRDDIARPPARRKAEAWVLAHQPAKSAGAFNEALMELGATICTPRSPECGACPVAHVCVARAEGTVATLPVKTANAAPIERRVALAIARRGGALLLEKRDAGLLAGTWGLPWVEVADGDDATDALAAYVARLTGGAVSVAHEPRARGTHTFTHRRWRMEAYDVDAEGSLGEWRNPHGVALGTAHRRILAGIDAGT